MAKDKWIGKGWYNFKDPQAYREDTFWIFAYQSKRENLVSQGVDNYDFEEKNKWRVMMWHRVAARLKKCRKQINDSLVIYLAGEQDLDRTVALRKGFISDNLIAVDIDDTKVKALRQGGAIAVRGDIMDIVSGWTHEKKPQVIYADLCSNLSMSIVQKITDALISNNSIEPNCVVVLNFQRGREPKNVVRELFDEDNKYANQLARDFNTHIKNRGLQFLVYMSAYFQNMNNSAREKGFDNAVGGIIEGEDEDEFSINIVKSLHPECLSYRGNKIYMDSVIFTWALRKTNGSDPPLLPCGRKAEKLKYRVAAAMALRTMKLSG